MRRGRREARVIGYTLALVLLFATLTILPRRTVGDEPSPGEVVFVSVPFAWDGDWGTRISTADDACSTIGLPFTWDFFGTPFPSIQVSTNGAVYRPGQPLCTLDWYVAKQNSTIFPSNTSVYGVAYRGYFPYWADLSPNPGGINTTEGVWLKITPTRVIVTWNDEFNPNPATRVTMQAVITNAPHPNNVCFRYLVMDYGSNFPNDEAILGMVGSNQGDGIHGVTHYKLTYGGVEINPANRPLNNTAICQTTGAAPLVSNAGVVPDTVPPGAPIIVNATVDDATTGGSNITAARVRIDAGSPDNMNATDGAFDEITEDVGWNGTAPSLPGPHTACVEGQDAAGWWSAPVCASFSVLAPPNPPTDLWARLVGVNWTDVLLAWNPSVGGNVDHQEVCWGTAYDGTAGTYSNCVTLTAGDTMHEFGGHGDGNASDFFYVVKAVDAFGNEAVSNQAAKVTRALSAGLHLVSTPLVQQDTSPPAVFRTLIDELNFAETYVCTDAMDPWKSWVLSKPYSDFTLMDHRMGAWVKLRDADSFTTAGQVPTSTAIPLCAGYSMIGFPSFRTTYTAGQFRADTGATRVQTSNASGNGGIVDVPDAAPMLAGVGYWVRAPVDTTWTIGQP